MKKIKLVENENSAIILELQEDAETAQILLNDELNNGLIRTEKEHCFFYNKNQNEIIFDSVYSDDSRQPIEIIRELWYIFGSDFYNEEDFKDYIISLKEDITDLSLEEMISLDETLYCGMFFNNDFYIPLLEIVSDGKLQNKFRKILVEGYSQRDVYEVFVDISTLCREDEIAEYLGCVKTHLETIFFDRPISGSIMFYEGGDLVDDIGLSYVTYELYDENIIISDVKKFLKID